MYTMKQKVTHLNNTRFHNIRMTQFWILRWKGKCIKPFSYSLKKWAPIVNYPTSSDKKKVASGPLLESLFPTSLFVARGWLRFTTALQNSCEGSMLLFNKASVSCETRTKLPSVFIMKILLQKTIANIDNDLLGKKVCSKTSIKN